MRLRRHFFSVRAHRDSHCGRRAYAALAQLQSDAETSTMPLRRSGLTCTVPWWHLAIAGQAQDGSTPMPLGGWTRLGRGWRRVIPCLHRAYNSFLRQPEPRVTLRRISITMSKRGGGNQSMLREVGCAVKHVGASATVRRSSAQLALCDSAYSSPAFGALRCLELFLPKSGFFFLAVCRVWPCVGSAPRLDQLEQQYIYLESSFISPFSQQTTISPKLHHNSVSFPPLFLTSDRSTRAWYHVALAVTSRCT